MPLLGLCLCSGSLVLLLALALALVPLELLPELLLEWCCGYTSLRLCLNLYYLVPLLVPGSDFVLFVPLADLCLFLPYLILLSGPVAAHVLLLLLPEPLLEIVLWVHPYLYLCLILCYLVPLPVPGPEIVLFEPTLHLCWFLGCLTLLLALMPALVP